MKPRIAVVRRVACGLIVLITALLAPHVRPSPAVAQNGTGSDLVATVNAFREAQGMPALIPDPALMAAAQRQANWNAANHASSHLGEGDTMPQDRAAAAGYTGYVQENVADGTLGYVTVTWAVDQLWANSFGHRLTMLADATHIGGGVAVDSEKEYYVLLIGRPGSNFPPPPGADWGPDPARTPEAASVVTTTEETASPAPLVVPIVLAEPDADGNVYHVVQPGQTAWAIAARYGVSLDELLALNGLQRSTILKPGDRVLVRLGDDQVAPPTATPQTRVIVEVGQTVWEIAATHGLTVDELLAFNGLTRDDVLRPGDELWLVPPEDVTEGIVTEAALMPSPSDTVTTAPSLTPTRTASATLAPTETPTASSVPGTPVAAAPAAAQATATQFPSPVTPTLSATPATEHVPDASAGIQPGTVIAVVAIGIAILALVGIGLWLWFAPRS